MYKRQTIFPKATSEHQCFAISLCANARNVSVIFFSLIGFVGTDLFWALLALCLLCICCCVILCYVCVERRHAQRKHSVANLNDNEDDAFDREFFVIFFFYLFCIVFVSLKSYI